MATIDDYGDTSEPLNNPPLGGPSGWAKAVRDYLAVTVPGLFVAKAGDTMTGALTVQTTTGRSLILNRSDRPGNSLTPQVSGGALGITNLEGSAFAPMLIGEPIDGEPSSAATKGYVDTLAVAAFNAGRVDAGLPTLSDAETRTRLGLEGE